MCKIKDINIKLDMKSIIKMGFAAIIGLALTSCIKSGDLKLDPVPDIAFSYTSQGFTLTFNSTVEGVSDIVWKTSDGGSGTGSTLTHTFPKPDTYWVEMRGNYKGVNQTVSAKIRVAKQAKVKMDDNSVEDWNNVTYTDFVFTGKEPGTSPIVEGKFDYDVNFVYLYLAFDTSVDSECDADKAVLAIAFDVDADLNTGFLYEDKIGSEYLVEGALTGSDPWFDVHPGRAGADWWDDAEDKLKAGVVFGHKQMEGNICKAEFAFDRNLYGITSTKMMLLFILMNAGWNDVDTMQREGDKYITLLMDKME